MDPPADGLALWLVAHTDAPRCGVGFRERWRRLTRRVDSSWLLVALLLSVAVLGGLRGLGIEDGWVGFAQMVPTVGLLVYVGVALDSSLTDYSVGASDAAGVAVALALHEELTRRPPAGVSVGLVVAGAGEAWPLGFERWRKMEKRSAADTVIVELGPCGWEPSPGRRATRSWSRRAAPRADSRSHGRLHRAGDSPPCTYVRHPGGVPPRVALRTTRRARSTRPRSRRPTTSCRRRRQARREPDDHSHDGILVELDVDPRWSAERRRSPFDEVQPVARPVVRPAKRHRGGRLSRRLRRGGRGWGRSWPGRPGCGAGGSVPAGRLGGDHPARVRVREARPVTRCQATTSFAQTAWSLRRGRSMSWWYSARAEDPFELVGRGDTGVVVEGAVKRGDRNAVALVSLGRAGGPVELDALRFSHPPSRHGHVGRSVPDGDQIPKLNRGTVAGQAVGSAAGRGRGVARKACRICSEEEDPTMCREQMLAIQGRHDLFGGYGRAL